MLHLLYVSLLKEIAASPRSKVKRSTWGGKVPLSTYLISRGDVILTPSWHWHDHGHEGGAPMIWLDGLDLPMYQAIPVNFAQGYKEHRYPSLETPESMHKLPWKTVHCALASIPGPYARYQYLLPSGKPLSSIIGAEAERIDARMEAPRRRETASFVYHVVEGTGRTVFDDGEVILWEKSDTFCIPAWKAHYHVNDCDETVYLFSFSDRPLLENLGMFRREEGAHNVDGSV